MRSGQNTLRSDYGKINVEGDLQTPQMPPSLVNKFFFIPRFDLNPEDSSTKLLIDREMVSIDGSVCNKIGTSYVAFNTQQQNPCE